MRRESPELRYAINEISAEEFLDQIDAGPTPLEVDGKKLTPEDAVQVQAFAEFLARAGQPPKPQEPAS